MRFFVGCSAVLFYFLSLKVFVFFWLGFFFVVPVWSTVRMLPSSKVLPFFAQTSWLLNFRRLLVASKMASVPGTPKNGGIWRNVASWYFIWLSNSHCGRLRKSQNWCLTLVRWNDDETKWHWTQQHTTRRPSTLKFLCDVWSSVALSKPVATVCPAQRRLYVCVGYTVVHKLSLSLLSYPTALLYTFSLLMATWLFFLSFSLFSFFPFHHQVHTERWARERHTHSQSV